jgi:hypothetical protein
MYVIVKIRFTLGKETLCSYYNEIKFFFFLRKLRVGRKTQKFENN